MASREKPPPSPGFVDVRFQGRREDIARLLLLLDGAVVLRRCPDYAYPDRNGVTVRRYLTADLAAVEEVGGEG